MAKKLYFNSTDLTRMVIREAGGPAENASVRWVVNADAMTVSAIALVGGTQREHQEFLAEPLGGRRSEDRKLDP